MTRIAGATGLATAFAMVGARFIDVTDDIAEGQPEGRVEADTLREAHSAYNNGDFDRAYELYLEAGLTDRQLEAAAGRAVTDATTQQDATEADRFRRRIRQHYGATFQTNIDDIAKGAFPNDSRLAVPGQSPGVTQSQQHDFEERLAQAQAGVIMENMANANIVIEGFDDQDISAPVPGAVELTVEQAVGGLHEMDPAELTDLQHKLFATGFYRNRGYEDISFGRVDLETVSAFKSFLDNAAMHTSHAMQTHQRFKPWRGLLNEWVGQAGGVEAAIAEQKEMSQPAVTLTLSDPAAVRGVLEDVSRDVIGRTPTPEMQRKFVAMIHNQQRDQQTARQEGQFALQTGQGFGGEAVETLGVDVGAQAQDFLRGQRPEEAEGLELARQYQTFLDIIDG